MITCSSKLHSHIYWNTGKIGDAGRPGFESWFFHQVILWCWVSHFFLLGLDFPINFLANPTLALSSTWNVLPLDKHISGYFSFRCQCKCHFLYGEYPPSTPLWVLLRQLQRPSVFSGIIISALLNWSRQKKKFLIPEFMTFCWWKVPFDFPEAVGGTGEKGY